MFPFQIWDHISLVRNMISWNVKKQKSHLAENAELSDLGGQGRDRKGRGGEGGGIRKEGEGMEGGREGDGGGIGGKGEGERWEGE
jgi:hypothetical protein